MEILKYSGKLAEIVELVRDAGEPPDVRAVFVTREEMDEILDQHAFLTTVSKYYGDSSTMVYNSITSDTEGNIISLYLNHILIALAAEDPTGPLVDLVYPPITVAPNGASTFVKDGNLLVGTGNPATGMVVGSNANIEMSLAIRKANDATYYGDGAGKYSIEIDDNEDWNFVVSVGSMNAEIPNVTDMYNIKLSLDLNPHATQETPIVWDLKSVDGFITGKPIKNYVWYKGVEPVIYDGATNEELSVTQSIQKYSFLFISKFIPDYVKRNDAGAPFGDFAVRLTATPKTGTTEPLVVEVMASIGKKL